MVAPNHNGITATDSAGQTSAVQTASFTVLAPKRAKARKE